MAKQFPGFETPHVKLIEASHIFFVGTAARDGRVNVSPKGMDSLRLMGPNRVLWMNLTGSGNETAGHLSDINRMTLMWCSFDAKPMILRAYGTACTLHVGDPDWADLASQFPDHRSARQIFDMQVEMVQSSCGYAVPFMDYTGERPTMQNWVDQRSDAEIQQYWQDKNRNTIDGLATGVPEVSK